MGRPGNRFLPSRCMVVIAFFLLGWEGRLSFAQLALPSIAGVHGNKGDSVDYVSMFLTGCKYDCQNPSSTANCACRKAVYHAPSDWLPIQLHLNASILDYSL